MIKGVTGYRPNLDVYCIAGFYGPATGQNS
jgi:hypothetical protein